MIRREHQSVCMRRVHESIRKIVEQSGYEYVNSELRTEEGHPVLCVYIDSLGGISIKDCETVSRCLGRMLDEGGLDLPEKYFLQVSSPGVERPLLAFSDYERLAGKKARLKLREPIDERKTMTGIIESAIDGIIVLLDDEVGRMRISFENIIKANLVFESPSSNKPGKKEKNKRRQQ